MNLENKLGSILLSPRKLKSSKNIDIFMKVTKTKKEFPKTYNKNNKK